MGRDDRDAARGGAVQMHGCCVGERPPLDPPVGRGAFDRDTKPARDYRISSWRWDGAGSNSERDRPRRGFGWPAGRAGAGMKVKAARALACNFVAKGRRLAAGRRSVGVRFVRLGQASAPKEMVRLLGVPAYEKLRELGAFGQFLLTRRVSRDTRVTTA